MAQTGKEMGRLALAYKEDMAAFATYSLFQIFEIVKGIPYRFDPEGVEYLQRPYYTLRGLGLGSDCDDKAIAIGAWAALQKLPFRFVAVGRAANKPLHHVFTEVLVNNVWTVVDATYAHNVLGYTRGYALREVIFEARP